MSRGGWRGGGRPRKAEHLKRKALHDFRLPAEWILFLKLHKRQGSLMIENALFAMFGDEFKTWQSLQDHKENVE